MEALGKVKQKHGMHSGVVCLFSPLATELGNLIYGHVKRVSVVLFRHIRKQDGRRYSTVDKIGSSGVGLLNLCAVDTESQIILCCAVHCGMVNSIPGLYPPDPSSNPPVVTAKNVSKQYDTSAGGKITPIENNCSGVRLLTSCVTFDKLLTLSGPQLYHL